MYRNCLIILKLKNMRILITSLILSIITLSLNAQSVSFKLKNNSAKSIPLKIPGVMNPNLSPFSTSGVDLKIGQKIFFKYKGKKRLLLEVSKEQDGKHVIVNTLIKRRIKALNL